MSRETVGDSAASATAPRTDVMRRWQDLPDDLFALSFEDEHAEAIFVALDSGDPTALALLDVIRLAVRHIDALQERLDALPEGDPCPTCGAVQCACAYDSPDAVCYFHRFQRGEQPPSTDGPDGAST